MNDWMAKHGVKTVRLAKIMDITHAQFSATVNRNLYITGKAHVVSAAFAESVSTALKKLAEEISQLSVQFGSEDMKTVAGRVYDRACIDRIKSLKGYFNLRPFMAFALGWNETRYNNILGSRSSKSYGNITAQDVDDINFAISQIALYLHHLELIPDVTDSSSSE